MKKIVTLGVFFSLFACVTVFGQIGVAIGVGSCNSITITDSGVNIYPRTSSGPLVYVRSGRFSDDFCGYIAFDYIDVSQRTFTLYEVIDPTNPDRFNNLAYVTSNHSGYFTNLYVGTYIVNVFDAAEEIGVNCIQQGFPVGTSVDAPFKVFNTLGQFLGWAAESGGLFNGLKGSNRRTGDIVVGQSRIVDNDWHFIGQSGATRYGNIPVYLSNDIVRIDATKSKNYNEHFIAIQEFWPDGTPGRWRAKGNGGYGAWINGLISNNENLSDIWDGGTGWTFLEYNKYQVQVVIKNSNCISWTQVLQNFVVCPGALGCRIGEDNISQKIFISPNPTSDKFKINGIDFDRQNEYQVLVSDMAGKIIQHFEQITNNEFDTNNIPNGVYVILLNDGDRRLFSSKLVVNR